MIRNILEYLEKSADLFGEHIAVSDEKNEMSFVELKNLAQKIGSFLSDYIIIGEPVAVYMKKTCKAVAAFMGVVYAGGCYAPVDITMPEKRVELILTTLESKVVIADREAAEKLKKLNYTGEIIIFDDLIDSLINEERLNTIRNQTIDCDPLYIIFTSGSTGVPKGVVLDHRSVIDLAEWIGETFHFDETTIFGNQTPFYFDASVKEIYSMLRNASTMVIIPQKLFSFPTQLFSFMNDRRINTILWATSAICQVANEEAFENETPKYLKTVTFAGEAMPVKQLNFWRSKLPDVTFANLYGPTEATVDSSYYIVDRDFSNDESIPIGHACRNMNIMILDGDRPVKSGEIGEICIRGTALAKGYYNNPEKTNAVFVQNPLNNKYIDLIYRTGDMGYYNELGEIMFAAREDDQIKHRGYRIELGEIETALGSLDGIDRCCCLYDYDKESIICIYTGLLNRREIIVGISKMIPKYMWPNEFIALEEFPMSLNGKIDRVKLKEEYINNGKN